VVSTAESFGNPVEGAGTFKEWWCNASQLGQFYILLRVIGVPRLGDIHTVGLCLVSNSSPTRNEIKQFMIVPARISSLNQHLLQRPFDVDSSILFAISTK